MFCFVLRCDFPLPVLLSQPDILVFRSQDAVRKVLEAIVQLGGERVDAGLDHGLDQDLQLFLRQAHVEAIPESFDGGGAVPETGQLGVGLQDLDQRDQLFVVLSCGDHSLQDQDFEVLEHVTPHSTHHLRVCASVESVMQTWAEGGTEKRKESENEGEKRTLERCTDVCSVI